MVFKTDLNGAESSQRAAYLKSPSVEHKPSCIFKLMGATQPTFNPRQIPRNVG
jgi:hypothetical protein